MNHAVIVTGDFVRTGGMDRANYALASYLARSGTRVELVAHRVASDLVALPGVTFHRVTKPCESYFLGQWPLSRCGARTARRALLLGGRAIVNGGNCLFADVNWVHYVHAAYQSTSAGSLLHRGKRRLEHPLNVRNERRALRAARVVICNSVRTRQDVVERVGVPLEKTRVVYYGSDAREFFPAGESERRDVRTRLDFPQDRPIVTFVGALGDRRKGFDTLYKAWSALRSVDRNWDPLLFVVGAGGELPAWRRRTADDRLDDSIRFLGFRTDVPDILRASDLIVAPARYEAYGLGVHEAICCDVPAIVSHSAGVAERFAADLFDLRISDPDDAAELESRLRDWRNNAERYRAAAARLGLRFRAYSWDDMGRDFVAAIDEYAQPSPSDELARKL